MKRKVSNSMGIENDPYFTVRVPVCKACKNLINKNVENDCKIYGKRPREYAYAEKYDCPKRDIDKNNINYKRIKDKI